MKIVQQMQDPVPLSIVEAEATEEIFLSYKSSPGNYGRGIERDGIGSPKFWSNDSPHYIYDAHAQRRGSWFIRKGDRDLDNSETRRRMGLAGVDPLLLDDFRAMVNDTELDCHEVQFPLRVPAFAITGMQGSGDLTMNYWNVAYVNTGGVRELVCLENEDVWDRVYTCLIKWNARIGNRQVVSIEEVRFCRRQDGTPDVKVFWNRQWLERGDNIEFAASNQRVIRDGEIVPAAETCHQFGDIRHLLQTPNLNPAGALYPGEPRRRNGQFERTYFARVPAAEVWLGEQEFIGDNSRNLLRAALCGPVLFRWPLLAGANERQSRGALTLARYTEERRPSRLLGPENGVSTTAVPTRTSSALKSTSGGTATVGLCSVLPGTAAACWRWLAMGFRVTGADIPLKGLRPFSRAPAFTTRC